MNNPIAAREMAPACRPELLGLRRRMLGLSQLELAQAAGISQGTLSKLEQGLKDPSPDQVTGLARALHCRQSFFFQAEREYGPPMSAHTMWRKKASVGAKVTDRVVAELNVRIGHLRTLLRSVDFEPELGLPKYDVDDFDGDVEAIAGSVRRAWYLPRGPIASLTELVERAGCIVVRMPLDEAQIDGVSYRVPGMPPIIFINRSIPADRARFTLAHELGHLIMHAFPEPQMEQQANDFASALLMPREDIAPSLRGITLEQAAQLKPYWKASMGSLLFRAKTIGELDESRSGYLWRQMSIRGYRTREPIELDLPHEATSLFEALVRNTTQDLGYAPSDLEELLHIPYEEISEMYGLSVRPLGLRRIK